MGNHQEQNIEHPSFYIAPNRFCISVIVSIWLFFFCLHYFKPVFILNKLGLQIPNKWHIPVFSDICRTSDAERFNCGPVGVSEATCRTIGCCYNAEKGLCFRTIPCNRPQNTPDNCGWAGISAAQCVGIGCCDNRYSHAGTVTFGVHWCLSPRH